MTNRWIQAFASRYTPLGCNGEGRRLSGQSCFVPFDRFNPLRTVGHRPKRIKLHAKAPPKGVEKTLPPFGPMGPFRRQRVKKNIGFEYPKGLKQDGTSKQGGGEKKKGKGKLFALLITPRGN
jgi:hypothetical protein